MTSQSTTEKKRLPFLVIVLIVLVVFCVISLAVSSAMDALGLNPTNTPTSIPTFTPKPVATLDSRPEKFADEYNGSIEVYREIFNSMDCKFLQEHFDAAYANNENAEPGTVYFKRSLGFMTATDERMQEIGCYK